MEDILRHIDHAASVGCRLVMNMATLENLHEAMQTMHMLDWSPTVTQVNVAHGQAIANYTRLAPLNPVFIVAGGKA